MPKKVKISLTGIVNQIDQATRKLSRARGKAATRREKQKLAAKIKNLKSIKAQVKQLCPTGARGLTILVPSNSTD
jgi:hypothetical protein